MVGILYAFNGLLLHACLCALSVPECCCACPETRLSLRPMSMQTRYYHSAINWERVCHAPALSIYGSISTLLRCSIQTFRKRLRQPGHLDKYVILSDIAPFPARGPPFSLEHQHGMALAVRPASASHTLGQMGIH